jgi:hypothetical protein
MNDKHPITPPPELATHWLELWTDMPAPRPAWLQWVVTQAARWGADQELDACCEWLEERNSFTLAEAIRSDRRPKPPTLKEQALDALREAESTGCLYVNGRSDLIRKALETLP